MTNQGDFFVMLNTHCGGYTPLIESDSDDMASFSTKEQAIEAAKDTYLGSFFGFEVFETGLGAQVEGLR